MVTLVLFILAICAYIYYHSDSFQLKCIVSTVDGNKYCVREREKLQDAADLLAAVTKKCKDLVNYMYNKYPQDDRSIRLKNGFNPQKIMETLPTSKFTAYSENKGEKLAFCTTTTKEGSKLIDENTLTFVALHEISHIATESIGHKKEFWENFKFILKNAVSLGIYEPKDYKKNPKKYCGMTITDNPYYDL